LMVTFSLQAFKSTEVRVDTGALRPSTCSEKERKRGQIYLGKNEKRSKINLSPFPLIHSTTLCNLLKSDPSQALRLYSIFEHLTDI
jgi:hypothetical protein